MKASTLIAAFLSFAFLFVSARAQEKETNTMEQKKEMTEMMKDSSMMNIMMNRIAADKDMRMMMMEKMMKHSEKDSSGMADMCKMMMKNKHMHSMMMKMMMGRSMMEQGMMKPDKMQKKSSDTTMTDHEAHHEQ